MEKSPEDTLIPTERRKKDSNTKGEMDNDGFFRTPNGSFWDCDGEYFNRNGFDIHSGYYVNVLDYIPGPSWLADLGCYPEDKEKYLQEDKDFDDDDGKVPLEDYEEEGDFCDGNDDDVQGELTIEDYKKFGLSDEEIKKLISKTNPNVITSNTNTITNTQVKDKEKVQGKGKGKNKGKKSRKTEEEWEECDES